MIKFDTEEIEIFAEIVKKYANEELKAIKKLRQIAEKLSCKGAAPEYKAKVTDGYINRV